LDQIGGSHGGSINELLAVDVDRHFPTFAKAHETDLRSYIIGRGADLSDVDEIAQDSLVAMYFWLQGCHPQKIRKANLKAYLYRIAENRVRIKQREYRKRYDPLRSHGSFLEQITETDIFDALIGEEKQPKGPEDVYLYKEWRQELLQHLPEDYRKIFTAHLDGWTSQEISAHFRISLNSVKYILRQCRKVLQSLPGLRY
jgi:RNA polymerase sigma factor (sigma-70 family)